MRFPNSALAIGTLCAAVQASLPGADYEALPLNTIFPGPWESNIKAPANKSYIEPVRIYNWEGSVVGAETVLENAEGNGISWVIRPGALVTFEFAENIGGRYVFTFASFRIVLINWQSLLPSRRYQRRSLCCPCPFRIPFLCRPRARCYKR
jgi:hypothetical protein